MKIAYVTSRFPYPVEKGDKLRAFHQIRSLSRNHDVYLFALTHTPVSEEHLKPLEEYCAGIFTFLIPRYKIPFNTFRSLMNGLPFQVGYFLDPGMKKKFQSELIKLQPDHVIAQLIRTSEYVRNIPFSKTLDYMDAFSFGAKQRSIGGQILLRPFYRWEENLLRKYERRVYASFDHHTMISHQDRDRLLASGLAALGHGLAIKRQVGRVARDRELAQERGTDVILLDDIVKAGTDHGAGLMKGRRSTGAGILDIYDRQAANADAP